MPGRREKMPAHGAVLRMFRLTLGLTEEEVADRAGVTRPMVCHWERGKAPLSRDRLVEALAPWILPEAIDEALLSHELGQPPQALSLPTEATGKERTLIHRTAVAAGQRAAQTTRTHLFSESHHRQARQHRAWAEERWRRLAGLSSKRQEAVIGALLGDEKSWALAERLCLASASAAANLADEALRLALLAVRVAEHSPGPDPWLLRLRGWCEPFLANAIRVGGELSAAEEAFTRAEDFWRRGATGDPTGLLDGSRRLDLKASLRMYQGHFEEARQLLDQALDGVDDPRARGLLLLKKANTFKLAGEYEASLAVLRQAEPLIDETQEQRSLFLHRFTWAVNLCHLDRFEAAEPLVALVETLAADLDNELDQVRAVWLKGRIWAGIGRREEAIAALCRIRRYFRTKEIAYDFALVSLEVAVLHLEQNRSRLVQDVAEEMLWIFKTQKVHKEALAALTLFCHAAEDEEAGTEWTRRLIKFLYRAQHNHRLYFEP